MKSARNIGFALGALVAPFALFTAYMLVIRALNMNPGIASSIAVFFFALIGAMFLVPLVRARPLWLGASIAIALLAFHNLVLPYYGWFFSCDILKFNCM